MFNSFIFSNRNNPIDIISYRNENVIARFAKEQNVSISDSEECFVELLKFLSISAKSQKPCSPSPKVDEMWHIFITYTKDYRFFCKKYLGKFIDHIPDTKGVDGFNGFVNTIKLIHSTFGEIDCTIWGIEKSVVNMVISNPNITEESLILKAGSSCLSCLSCHSVSSCNSGSSSKGCFVLMPILATALGSLMFLFVYLLVILTL